ncbi:hypothetical protein [Aliivibrio salmonicida]|uniref:hypothetical protein n=1 Tax=Aliivibrio salmonicida TaxID=40269 RepID=UPI001F5C133B|nr:hypothetical protein [Aliivibrio salmonicida]
MSLMFANVIVGLATDADDVACTCAADVVDFTAVAFAFNVELLTVLTTLRVNLLLAVMEEFICPDTPVFTRRLAVRV